MLAVRFEELSTDPGYVKHLNSLTPNTGLTDVDVCDSDGLLYGAGMGREKDRALEIRALSGLWTSSCSFLQ
ncbi:hypothetical protein J6590_098990, partial [Homalodisca vitripennis]